MHQYVLIVDRTGQLEGKRPRHMRGGQQGRGLEELDIEKENNYREKENFKSPRDLIEILFTCLSILLFNCQLIT